MRNKIDLPGVTAEASMPQSAGTHYAGLFGIASESSLTIQPQFRSRVRTQCGPCRNRIRECITWGYECTVVPGVPGSDELGIPGTPPHIRCEPEIFREFEQRC